MSASKETRTAPLRLVMPLIASVRPGKGHLQVIVTWQQGIRPLDKEEAVDLSPLVNAMKFYRPLREDRKLFRTVHLIDDGNAVAWGDAAIDMAATSIERLAEETMTADDFRIFLSRHSLTHAEAAAVLGRSRRQIENYLSGALIPRVVALACYGYVARKQHLASGTMGVSVGSICAPPQTSTGGSGETKMLDPMSA